MKRVVYILTLLLPLLSQAQIYQADNTYGKTMNRVLPYYNLGVPNDTIAPVTAYQNYPHIAAKDSVLYVWSPSGKRFRAISAAAAAGGGGSYTFLAPLSNDGGVVSLASVPWSLLTGKPTTLSGYGITDALRVTDTAGMLAPYLRKGTTGTGSDTLRLNAPLYQLGKEVFINYSMPTYNAAWLQNRLVMAGEPRHRAVLIYDSTQQRWEHDTITIPESANYTFTAPLNNAAGTISIPAANGSTNGYLSAADWNKFNNKLDSVKTRNDSAFYYKSGTEYFAGLVGGAVDTSLLATRYWVSANFYTQSALQSSGQASVHWDNLTNKPTGLLTSVPTWEQVLNRGGTTTSNATTSGNITGGELRTTNSRVRIFEGSTDGYIYWQNADSIQARITGAQTTGDGQKRSELLIHQIALHQLTAKMNGYTTGRPYIYARKDSLRFFFNGTEYNLLAPSGVADGNNYPAALSFNTSTNVLTLQRNGLSDLTADLSDLQDAAPTLPAVQTFTDGASITLDYNTSSGWKGTIAGNRTFTISNLPSNGVLLVTVTQDATAGRQPTFSGVTWLGTPPSWPTTGGKSTVCAIWNDGGKIWAKRDNE